MYRISGLITVIMLISAIPTNNSEFNANFFNQNAYIKVLHSDRLKFNEKRKWNLFVFAK